ncbi:MAG: energy-coupling factor transport system substrate-specific component [Actinomycetota bacterium]|jgi:energy-coupling factor transport system substrate-specific component|nr:energy-coupling factor transport system substrate-specific component [Actinomycetota bacterium]
MMAVADRARPGLVYLLVGVVGAGSFLYPFWLPHRSLPFQAHAGDAPLVAALVGALAVAAVVLEVRRGTMNGATVALLGVLGATAGLLRLLDLPGGGSGIFFVIVLAGAAFGARFGLLLGLVAMATSAVITGGIGPWLPFQMLALAWMGAGAGAVGRVTKRLGRRTEVAVLAFYGWCWGFVYGAVMNLWFWPFAVDMGDLSWAPGIGLVETLHRYWSFYVVTSFGWDAAGALANAALIALTGAALLPSFRRFAVRLQPAVELYDVSESAGSARSPSTCPAPSSSRSPAGSSPS